jgi:uncharacterized membrane protein YeaQ/YmgE (transglycosylase-associated protein family)
MSLANQAGMHILWIGLIGFLVGVIAKAVFPGRAPHGFLLTSLLGVAGAVLAAMVGHLAGWYRIHEHAGFVASVLGAVGVLAIYRHYAPEPEEKQALDE